MIKYLGSKRTLLPAIRGVIGGPPRSVLDLFSGTSRVGHALKADGHRVIANDHNAYAATLARCYVAADAEDHATEAQRLIGELNALRGRPGYVTEAFCRQARYFQPHNGERIDAIRQAIADKGLEPELEAVLLVSLMEAADRVDSTTGVQMAWLKSWSRRSFNGLELRLPALLPRAVAGKGAATCRDAVEAATTEVDVAYLDPPYNQHSYLGNYHVWETLVRWDAPPTYGVANKRADVRERRSPFNSRRRFAGAMVDVLRALRARTVVVSFSDDGWWTRADLEAQLAALWGGAARVDVTDFDFPRYVGARIGIHNLQGERVGTVGRLRNTERLYVARAPD